MQQTTGDQLRQVAADTFGWSQLSAEQLQAMEHLMAGHDVLVVLPTGAGKSAIYQVPALLLDGLTLVVSPLIALQHDQLEGIEDTRAPQAVAVNSAQRSDDRKQAWQAIRRGEVEYVFLAPEQLAKDSVMNALAHEHVSLFVVDEAHCVSTWGHDFRPDYLRLAPLIEQLGHPRVLALTATAAPPVRRDIVHQLGMRDSRDVIASFDRPNLYLAVERFIEDTDKQESVIARVRTLTADPATRCGLVYAASRKETEFYAGELARSGVRVAAYHAGMAAADRERVHEQFLADQLDVVVATSAFGMGIDKPDVRFVAHSAVPDSVDSYYQQVGRAGRDGHPAEITLFYRPEDLSLQAFLTASKVPQDALDEVAQALRKQTRPMRLAQLKTRVNASPTLCTRAVNLLEQAGAVRTTSDGQLEYVDPDLPTDQAVQRAGEAARTQQRLVRSRIEMMRGYAETTRCRRQYLLGYFGEHLGHPCGNCDTCAAGTAKEQPTPDGEFALGTLVCHAEWGDGVVMSMGQDRMTVLFDEVGYKTLSLRAVHEHNLLTSTKDPAPAPDV
jgi:ATP-dependent DNA helicase RecQ